MKRRSIVALAALTAAAATIGVSSASGAGGAARTSAVAVTPPPAIKSAGQIVFCSDIGAPPEEFYTGRTPTGSDIAIAQAIAAQMGVKASFQNLTFSSLIAALLAKRCDAIISGMNDTAVRRQSVNFTDYQTVGQSLAVKKGDPHHITENLASLSGLSVAVALGSTNAAALVAASAKLKAAKKPGIDVVTFVAGGPDASTALETGRVDAYDSDSPVIAYIVLQNKSLALAPGPQITPAPEGIATRKGDPLASALSKAIKNLYTNGTMKTILGKWRMTSCLLPNG